MDIAKHRARLVAELNTHLHRADKIDAHQRNLNGEPPQDFEEQATFRENDEVVDRLETATNDEILRLRAAIERIDAGTSAECAVCGGPIPLKRLEILPSTTRCVACSE